MSPKTQAQINKRNASARASIDWVSETMGLQPLGEPLDAGTVLSCLRGIVKAMPVLMARLDESAALIRLRMRGLLSWRSRSKLSAGCARSRV